MTADGWDFDLIDSARSGNLDDAGLPGYRAAMVVSPDGTEYMLLARRDQVGDENARYDAACRAVEHEQLGPLPIEHCRRIAISRRRQRSEEPPQ